MTGKFRLDRDLTEKKCVENECTGLKGSGIMIHHSLAYRHVQMSMSRAVSAVLLGSISH
jgi:hypothetical protein